MNIFFQPERLCNPVSWRLPGYSWIEEYNDFWTDCTAYAYIVALALCLFLSLCTWMNVNACQAASTSTTCCFILKGLWSLALCFVCLDHQPSPQGFRPVTFTLYANLNMLGPFSAKFGLSIIRSSSESLQNCRERAEIKPLISARWKHQYSGSQPFFFVTAVSDRYPFISTTLSCSVDFYTGCYLTL